MRFTLLVITDGRQNCLERTMESAKQNLMVDFDKTIIVDDSTRPQYADWLDETYPNTIRVHHNIKAGFGGAIDSGWSWITALQDDPDTDSIDETDFVFHLEDDFVFNRPVDVENMAKTLNHRTQLAQLALKRQPWNEQEKAAGDLVSMWPDEYRDTHGPYGSWLEHTLFFTTNPSLYRIDLCQEGWPVEQGSEQVFTRRCLEQGKVFAFWGRREDPPWVTHIGDERVGTGY